MATDYMQMALELLGSGDVQLNIATTLEALDKAEAERDALRQAVKEAVEIAKGTSPQAAVRILEALIQPEPDPLVSFARDLLDENTPDDAIPQFLSRLQEALARHNLKIEEARHD